MKALRPILLTLCMVMASAGAVMMRPTQMIADMGPKVDLERMLPVQFGDWQADTQQPLVITNPVQTEIIAKIYDQTLSRTYVNRDGYRIMLSVAYGKNQTHDLQPHNPDVCYPAQGFSIIDKRKDTLATDFGHIPVRRMSTVQRQRKEPVTYWLTIGYDAVDQGLGQKLMLLRYGLVGQIPDGLLFRVSSIDDNTSRAYAEQDKFLRTLLATLPAPDRKRLSGLGPAEAARERS